MYSLCLQICLIFYLSLSLASYRIHHPEKKSKGVFHQITKTHGTVICVSTGVVLLLLIVSILVQVKQPRKKVIKGRNAVIYHSVEMANSPSVFTHNLKVLIRKNNLFHRGDFQEVYDPPHYELFTLRDKVSFAASIHHQNMMLDFERRPRINRITSIMAF